MGAQALLILLAVGGAIAAVTKKDRVIDVPLSDKEPGSPEYDHDAFLGREEAAEFEELSPEESRRRLGIIVDKIDKDGSGKITEEELENWIFYTMRRYINEDSDRQFVSHDADNDGKIHWDEYKEVSYGFLKDEDHIQDDEYQNMIDRDQRRWDKADENGDKFCTVEEFRAFLHPEEYDHMKDIVTKETLDDIDKNKDGFVDLEEYIGDMVNADEGDEKPEWVEREQKQFVNFRDRNKDGKLDMDEVREWIMPDNYSHANAEAKHLLRVSDDNNDGELSKEEIIAHHDRFVGSQATDWGEALNRHDEF